MDRFDAFWIEHRDVTRRFFLKLGLGGLASASLVSVVGRAALAAGSTSPDLDEKLERFSSYLTPDDRFGDVSRGDPLPSELPDEKKQAVGLTRDTWQLEVIADPEHPVRLRSPLSKSAGTAIDFQVLVELAKEHAVRFPKIMTCLNLGCPLGMGIWEGIPLRELVWMTGPREDVRRVFFYGYHNDDPKQMFRSSLPIGRVLEDYFGLPPVIVCYKLNGEWLSSERGGPVRIVVPEAYGFKNIKWLSHVVLTSLPHANDTYAEQGNDVDSPLKTFASTLSVPREAKAGEPLPLTGFAQVGVGGLSKVQVWIQRRGQTPPKDDASTPWTEMEILPPPERWGGGLPNDQIPVPTYGFDPSTGAPRRGRCDFAPRIGPECIRH